MSPPDTPQQSGDLQRFRRATSFLRGDLKLYGMALLLAPASALLVVVQPWLLGQAIDTAMIPGDLDALKRLSTGYLIAVLVGFVCEAGYTLSISYAAMRTIARLRDRIYQHLLSLAPSFFDQQPTGKLLTRVTSDVEALGETLTAGALTIILDVLLVIGILVAMFSLDPKLTLVLLGIAPLLGLFIDRIRRILRRLYLEVRTNLATLNAFTAERLNGVELVQLYADEDRTLGQFDEQLHAYRDSAIRTNIFDAVLYAVVDGLSSVAVALILWYACGDLLGGAITAGLLAAFVDYTAKLFRPIREFSSKVAVLQRAGAALEKIYAVLDEDDRVSSGDIPLKSPRGAIRIQDLKFAYRDGPDVLHGVDLEIAPGETVAVVGRTGSGKSTISRLLTRAYDGYRGSIQFDGHELADLLTADVRQAIGVVHQDVQLFPEDLRFNLSLGRNIGDERLGEVCRLARAEEVVERLGGLTGMLQHGGANVSQGEAQLLSFARTMAADPALVVLDEATASVDSITEERIQAATAEILARKTVLVIAHRLSTVRKADRIAVLDAGVVVESGRHEELIEHGGIYAGLVAEQLRDD